MEDGVWFSAAIGRRKNAEARWLLPMICRRGGIEKQDVGTIRVLDTTTEFEVSERVAASFTAKIRRPDKEDNIRIETLAAPSAREEVREKEWTPKPHGKSAKTSDKPMFDKKPRYDTKRRDRGEQAHAGKPRHEHGASAKPVLGKKKKKKFRG
jgi:ATP-dependent RNA helicase DeaD